MNCFTKSILKKAGAVALATIISTLPSMAQNYAWPSQFEGVMLQGFYWDSYKGTNNTKWSTLTKNAEELSKYFKVIWVPNSAKAASNPGMGYDPVYWFTNHNTAFGTEQELRTMISTFKALGTDMIEDVVINHRSGKSNWTDFPAETWRGKTYQLGPQHICSNDEVAWATGQAKPTGAPDTGENFDGSRDLDHTNATVQENCKAYCTFLIEDLGYAGFRYDMAKGYSGKYNKMYNEASKPKYSVGEFWDGYDGIAWWIESTGKQSAAFDFPCKYALRDAFNDNDMTKLVWKANGTTDQPAGLIHFNLAQYAVTFVDNHDTYRDGYNKFNGSIPAANAFILCSPGTPCVFYPHYVEYKNEIQKLIQVRNAVGVHNQSAVKVLQSSGNCYMAEVTGKRGKLVVKIGSAMASPSGYSDSDIVAVGKDYCVWTKASTEIPDNPKTPFKVYFNNTVNWTTPHIHYWGGEESKWPGVAMTAVQGANDIWEYTVPAGTTGILFNAGDGDATKTQDMLAAANHVYTTAGDQGVYNGGNTPTPGNYPANLYLLGNLEGKSWASAHGITQHKKNGGVYEWSNISFDDSGDGYSYFSFLTKLDTTDGEWTLANDSDRYGAASDNELITVASSASIVCYPVNVSASGAKAWKVNPGNYQIKADLATKKLTLSTSTGVDNIDMDADSGETYYFNLQGEPIANPTNGIFIKVTGGKATKVMIR